ncbi:MAG: HAD-IA family hydrolase [Planctomycetota bacterium]
MALRAVFLDLGETLLTTRLPRFEIYAQAARDRNRDVTAGEMRSLMGRVHHALPERLDGAPRYSDPWFAEFIRRIFGAELGFAGAELAAITAELFARFEDPATFCVYPGAEELFAAVRARGLALGIVSNWSARLPRLLARLGWAERLDFALASAIVGTEKPSPGIFAAALSRAGARPEEALHAGDHPELDVAAARAVGIEGVLVDHAGACPDAAAADGSCVRDLRELRSYILDRAE